MRPTMHGFMKLALALAALAISDLAVGALYRVLTGDSVYYTVFHPDRGRNRGYRTSSPIYHHDLRKNVAKPAVWGGDYFVYTNSLGFRDREVREVPLEVRGPRLVLIGDSFAEGVGVDFDDTLAGILAAHFRERGVDVLDAGVSSYSPTIYERKVRHLLEDVGLRFTELIVLLDVSDVADEASSYRRDAEGNVVGPGESFEEESVVRRFFRRNSVLYGVPHLFRGSSRPFAGDPGERTRNRRSRWTFDDELYAEFGERGLRRAAESMTRLARLLDDHGIELTVVVYPWPAQILERDRDSVQVRFWRDWSRRNGASFVDLFPSFVADDPSRNERAVSDLFIEDDFHWNEAGHALAARELLSRLPERIVEPRAGGPGAWTP